ncbi:MAG TPA: OmpH family outer membrane protein [Syntrophales bacterium]|jgi:outer membrane protein|nr:OmpH family outer membrane protein [Syntrophales bacterium]
MKKAVFGVIAGLLLLALSSGAAWSAEKVGFVNIQEAMLTSNAGKQMGDEMRRLIAKDKAVIEEKEKELKKLREDLEKQRTVLTESALREKEMTLQKKYRDYQVVAKDFEDDLRAKEQDIFKKLFPEVLKIVRSIAEKEKYTMVLDPYVLQLPYFNAKEDITKRVVEEFNRTFKDKKK